MQARVSFSNLGSWMIGFQSPILQDPDKIIDQKINSLTIIQKIKPKQSALL